MPKTNKNSIIISQRGNESSIILKTKCKLTYGNFLAKMHSTQRAMDCLF